MPLKNQSNFEIEDTQEDAFSEGDVKVNKESKSKSEQQDELIDAKKDELSITSPTTKILDGKIAQFSDSLRDFHNHDGENSELVSINNLHGFIETVTTVPTNSPRRFYEQFKIYTDSTTAPTDVRFYIYSFQNKAWYYERLLLEGTAAPGTTPSKTGDVFVDTTNDNIYISKGTAASGDWIQVNN